MSLCSARSFFSYSICVTSSNCFIPYKWTTTIRHNPNCVIFMFMHFSSPLSLSSSHWYEKQQALIFLQSISHTQHNSFMQINTNNATTTTTTATTATAAININLSLITNQVLSNFQHISFLCFSFSFLHSIQLTPKML